MLGTDLCYRSFELCLKYFFAVFPGTKLVKGRAPAGLCRTTKTFSGSGGQNKNFGIGPAAKELKRRAYASCKKKLAPPPPLAKPKIVVVRGSASAQYVRAPGQHAYAARRLVNANASIATLLKTFPKAKRKGDAGALLRP